MIVIDELAPFSWREFERALDEYDRREFATAVAPGDEPKVEWWQITHAAADASGPEAEKVIEGALGVLDKAPKGKIQDAIENGDANGALGLFDWQGFENELSSGFSDVFETIAERSGADTAIEIGKGFDYDPDEAFDLFVRGAVVVSKRITANTRKAVSILLRRMLGVGVSPFQLRSHLFALAGLDTRQMNSAVNQILAARDAGSPFAVLKASAESIFEEKIKERISNIVRFETLNVAQAAQEEAVNQGVALKILKNVVKVWVVVPDDSLCPICNRLRGQRVQRDKRFKDPATGLTYIGPPAHQRCRCGLRYIQARTARGVGVFVVDIREPDGEVAARDYANVLTFGGKHDQKTHGRKKSGKSGQHQRKNKRREKTKKGMPGVANDIDDHANDIGVTDMSDARRLNHYNQYVLDNHKAEVVAAVDGVKDVERAAILVHPGDRALGIPTTYGLGWEPAQGTDIHDHAKSMAVVDVVRGSVGETIYASPKNYVSKSKAGGFGSKEGTRVLTSGQTALIKSPYIHTMTGVTPGRSITLHSYWPPLGKMNYFTRGKDGKLKHDGLWEEGRSPDSAVEHKKQKKRK